MPDEKLWGLRDDNSDNNNEGLTNDGDLCLNINKISFEDTHTDTHTDRDTRPCVAEQQTKQRKLFADLKLIFLFFSFRMILILSASWAKQISSRTQTHTHTRRHCGWLCVCLFVCVPARPHALDNHKASELPPSLGSMQRNPNLAADLLDKRCVRLKQLSAELPPHPLSTTTPPSSLLSACSARCQRNA